MILRRLKDDHLKGLPEKHVHQHVKAMPKAQADAYKTAVSQARASNGDGRGRMLGAIHALKRVSLSPIPIEQHGIDDEVIAASAHLQAMVEVLDAIHQQGEKALMFVEYLDVQEALAAFLCERYRMNDPPMKISGKVAGAVRQKYVNRFQSTADGQFNVMLLSPKAGGVGLTLTSANHVIHLSRWWNPAVEDQCTDRVFRIGQTREVHIHYPLAEHPDYGTKSFD